MLHYLITIATQNGLTDEQLCDLKIYFSQRFKRVVMNVEPHKSGTLHCHAFSETLVQRAGVRAHIARFLVGLGIVVGPKTLKVQQADLNARQYVVKDVTPEKPVTLCQGWSIEDLLEERRQAIKKLSRKEIMGNWKVITQDEAIPLMLKFAASHTIAITDKHSFIQLGIAMMKEKFDFSRVKLPALYAQVMVQMGDNHAADDWFENQLIGLR